ncbi:hypothetical protein [Sphingobacterium multivorum]|uniref:hypothetical protein n=1 Tax=Sphingobacterium multivorum TaxID=28454 RepID=UPI002899D868|nr:hypothetical protein [Sphingobacterium multivorum]
MGKKFTPERLASFRRMRKARRLFKKQPLFAYSLMLEAYPDYTYLQFLDDLRYRRPPKKRKGKSGIGRYGRYRRMEELLLKYRQEGNIAHALQAQKLRERMAKPYRVRVTIGLCRLEYGFSPLVPIETIEKLVSRLAPCRTEQEADRLVQEFRETAHIH